MFVLSLSSFLLPPHNSILLLYLFDLLISSNLISYLFPSLFLLCSSFIYSSSIKQMDLDEEDHHRQASHHHAPFHSVAFFTTTTVTLVTTPPVTSLSLSVLNLIFFVLDKGKRRMHSKLMKDAEEIDGGGSSGGSWAEPA